MLGHSISVVFSFMYSNRPKMKIKKRWACGVSVRYFTNVNEQEGGTPFLLLARKQRTMQSIKKTHIDTEFLHMLCA